MKTFIRVLLLCLFCQVAAAGGFQPNSFTTANEADARSNAVAVVRTGLGLNTGFFTNGGVIVYVTNGVPQVAAPNGSLAIGTGQVYSRTNGAWVPIGSGGGGGGVGDVVAASFNQFTGPSNTFNNMSYFNGLNVGGTATVAEVDVTTFVLPFSSALAKANGSGTLVAATPGVDFLAPNGDASSLLNTASYTNFFSQTNLAIVFDGRPHAGTITNGPDVWLTFSGANGYWGLEVTTNVALHFSTPTRWLAGSNYISPLVFSITNGVLGLTSFGGTNYPHLKSAIVDP